MSFLKIFIVPFLLFFSLFSYGKIYINIGSPKVKKSMVALAPFKLIDIKPNNKKLKVGTRMDMHFRKNLKFSNYFKILESQAFIEDPSQVSSIPYPKDPNGFRWNNWKISEADFLFFGSYIVEGSKLILNVSFYNINSEKTVFRKKYTATTNTFNYLIDTLSNDIVKKLSGRPGIFKSKIVAIRNMRGSQKELFLMRWNGSQKKRITYHRSIVLSPSWSPKGDKIAYTAFVYHKKFKTRITALFLLNLYTNKIRILSQRNGANLGADFFPNGRDLLVTLGTGLGQMDIFKLNISNSSIQAITRGPKGAINVEPSIHPRNGLISFSSDQSGKTMIYTMTKNGKNIKRITFAGHYNSTPDWNPKESTIVFSGQSQGRFDLFSIRSNGTNLKRLTTLKRSNGTWANSESPSFSPDGKFVVFSSDVSGTYQLYILNVDDLSMERITFDRYNYKSPKWSPYL